MADQTDNPESMALHSAAMTPLERAAAAVRDETGAYSHQDFLSKRQLWMTEGGLVGDEYFEGIVRAVLTAIREPDKAMIEAGGEQVLDSEVGAGQYASIADGRGSKLMANNQAVNAWTAMIDAILAGGE